MKTFVIGLLLAFGLSAFGAGEPIQRNYWTTNLQANIVVSNATSVSSGVSNAFARSFQASTNPVNGNWVHQDGRTGGRKPVGKNLATFAVGQNWVPSAPRLQFYAGVSNQMVQVGYRSPTNTGGRNIEVVFGNPRGKQLTTNSILRVRSASFEYPSGTLYPLTFEGYTNCSIPPEGLIAADPIPVYVPTNTWFAVRAYIETAPGTDFPIFMRLGKSGGTSTSWVFNDAGAVQSYASSTNNAPDLTLSGTVTPNNNEIIAFSPMSICAELDVPVSLCGIQDSRGEVQNGWTFIQQNSYFGLDTIRVGASNLWPCIASSYAGYDLGAEKTNQFQLELLTTCATHLLWIDAVNNITGQVAPALSFTQITNRIIDRAAQYAKRGMRVYAATILPWTTSTDAFITTNNQTDASSGLILQVNTWLRTTPWPFTGVVDLAGQVETNNVWKTNLGTITADGLHLRDCPFLGSTNNPGSVAISRVISAWTRTLAPAVTP